MQTLNGRNSAPQLIHSGNQLGKKKVNYANVTNIPPPSRLSGIDNIQMLAE